MRLRSRSLSGFALCYVLALSLLVVAGCRKDESPADKAAQQQNTQQQWQDHVSEYTQGWVSTQTPLRIRFSHPVVKEAQLNKPLDGIVKLDPAQEVVAVFTADNVLEVRHPEPFPSGNTFKVMLVPTHLQNLPEDLPPLSWDVRVLEQSMSVREIGLAAQTGNDEKMQLQGVIETTDNADNKAVEKILGAQQQDQSLIIRWQHDDARTHKFTVENIQRGDAASRLVLRWDGTPINVANRGERTVDIPAARAFELTSARAVTQPDTYIELRFSQPLDARQNLTGLVRVNDSDARSQVDGAVLRVYPDAGNGRLEGEQRVHVDTALRSAQGKVLSQALDKTVAFIAELPAVRFAEKGNILPPAQRLTLPIEAVGVSAVQLRAFEVFPDNIGQYLQRNSFAYSGAGYINEYAHRDVGRYLWQKTIQLPQVPHSRWQRFDLDVSELVASRKGSLLRLELQILPQFSVYTCDAQPAASNVDKDDIAQQNYEGYDKSTPIPERLQRYYESEGYYDWSESKNPCSSSYYAPYRDHAHVAQMFFASNIGLLAKQGGDNTLHVVTTSLQTATPMAGTDIKVFNYQQQLIGSGKTDTDGMLTLKVEGVPFSLRADKDGDVNYLKVPRNEALPTGQFNTGGTTPSQGLKGFFYGERDIWRPGDDIYLTFILMDRDKTLPQNYPLTLEFFDPRGGKAESITNTSPLNGFYTFTLKTEDDAPTGSWRAIVKIGDNYFDQIIKIENIAPNRLKIDLGVADDGLHQDQLPLKTSLHAQWLTGATASTLKADVQLNLSATKTVFSGYEAYTFDDRARAFTSEPQKVFEGNLDEQGNATFDTQPTISMAPPGLLAATFTQRVFEPGGQFSSQYRSVPYFPFKSWAGVKAPSGNADYYGALDKDADHAFDLLSVDSHGKTQPQRALTVQLYELEWSWWWDERQQNYAQYISNNMHALKETATVTTDGEGHAQWTLHGKKYDWGQYLVRVCDGVDTGVQQHCASTELYLGWGYGEQGGRDAATRMTVSSDKENYRVGDTASIRLPDGPDRRVLVSIENGSRVLQRYWQDVKKGQNSFAVAVTADMTPNVYVHVAQLQPHQQRSNDLPIRLYGILPLLVDDPATHLTPAIKTVEKIRPESTLKVAVSETQGHAMTYTLALVDEGLLGITDYSAPDPHKTLYQREALGVLTWDMFDQVVGAYSAELARLLAVGGGDSLKKRDSNRERRFPPIVRFVGAFELKAGETREHSIELPPYMGAVRVMVVAGDGHAFGRAEQSIKVTQPLTLLTTLPRVLGPGEELDVPVNVFVTDELQGTANVGIVADDFFTVLKKDDAVSFDKAGEKLAHLRLKVNDRIGMATVTVAAALGSEKAQEVIHIPIRSANQPSTLTQTHLLQPGASWTPDFVPHGMPGTNTTALTVSSMPELKLEQRLQYLIGYPHGCIEQTTSAAFPQLYLPQLVELNAQQTLDVEQHVNAAIARLASFQTSSGGFAYWPYQSNVDPWANNYAGHFLLEAKQRGYSVPPTMLANWQRYQRDQARSFTGYGYAADAYRVYTLALAGSADTGAMNRLRERINAESADETAFWLLALAYQQIGQDTVANELLDTIDKLRLSGKVYNRINGWTYGSDLRDRSVLLLLRQKMGDTDAAWQIATLIAKELADDSWYSTQTTAWALLALAHSYGSHDDVATFAVQNGGATAAWQNLASKKPIYRETLDQYQPNQLTLRNDGKQPLYVAISNRGVAANADEKVRSKGLSIETRFTTIDGKPLAPNALKSGTDFVAEVTVTNISDRELTNIALTQVVPSGWQIRNTRLEGVKENADIDYQHIGDDRLVSYFALRPRGGNGNSDFYWWRDNRQLQNSVTVKVLLNASFAGRFYLPGWQAEPMYDAQWSAASVGQWVDVE
jgi:uncharacterized protein YfaS (alpha-2-macroglobulin family)